MKPIYKILLGAILCLVVFSEIYRSCKTPNNQIVTSVIDTSKFVQKTKYLKDSTHYVEVEAKLVQSQSVINGLQDSLQKAISENSKLKVKGIIKGKDSIVYRDVPGKYDSSDYYLDSLIAQKKIFDDVKSRLISVPRSFSFKYDKYFYGTGVVKKDTILLSPTIISEPELVFGESYKHFLGISYGKPTVKVLVGNANKHVIQDSIKPYFYSPKDKKFSLVLGTGVSFDGTSLKYQPIQLTFGIKLF